MILHADEIEGRWDENDRVGTLHSRFQNGREDLRKGIDQYRVVVGKSNSYLSGEVLEALVGFVLGIGTLKLNEVL